MRELSVQAEQRVSGSDVLRTHPFCNGHVEIPKRCLVPFSNCIVSGQAFDNRLIYAFAPVFASTRMASALKVYCCLSFTQKRMGFIQRTIILFRLHPELSYDQTIRERMSIYLEGRCQSTAYFVVAAMR